MREEVKKFLKDFYLRDLYKMLKYLKYLVFFLFVEFFLYLNLNNSNILMVKFLF